MTPPQLAVVLTAATALAALCKPGWLGTLAAAAALPVVWARVRRELPPGFFRGDPVFLGLLALAGVVLAQSLLGRTQLGTLGAVGQAAAFWAQAKLVAGHFPHRLLRGWQVFAWSVLVIIAGGWAGVQAGWVPDMALGLGHVVRTALFAAAALLATLAPALGAGVLPAWGPTLLLALLVAATGRRATLVATVLAALVWVRRPVHAAAVGVLAAAVATAVLLTGQASRFAEGFSLRSPSTYERVAVWHAALALTAEHPMLGCGFKTFKAQAAPHVAAFRAAHPADHTPERLDDAHNLVLHLAAETGGLGLTAVLAALILPMLRLWPRRADPTAALLLSLGLLLVLHLQLHMHLFSSNVAALTFTVLGQATGYAAALAKDRAPV